jgi:hypothetical protein
MNKIQTDTCVRLIFIHYDNCNSVLAFEEPHAIDVPDSPINGKNIHLFSIIFTFAFY